MAIVLVTVAGPQRSTDLALPAEAPVGELIPELVGLCVDPALRRPSARWALAPMGGDPFPPGRPVGDLGVLDGTVLQLRDMSAPAAPGSAETIDSARLERRQRITGLVEDLVHAAARLAGGHPAGDHTGGGRETVEDPRAILSPAPAVGDRLIPDLGDLELIVHWSSAPQAPIDVTARFVDRSVVLTAAGKTLAAAPAPVSVSLRVDAGATRVISATAIRHDTAMS